MKQTAFITGATDGIGKALAYKLLRENYEVVIIGRNPQKVNDTVSELKFSNQNYEISGITADLSKLSDVKRACELFLLQHSKLHLLVLNANAIANERIITEDGNEQNFAIGYLSRVLMTELLEDVLEKTSNAQIISVIGLDTSRVDFEDLTIQKNFTGRKGLTRWQWAINLYTQYYNKNRKVPMNLYMPGLVKTKILSNEPQPMRLLVQIMNVIMGITPQKSADNIFKIINIVTEQKLRNTTFSYSKRRKPLKVETKTGDIEKLINITKKSLRKFK